MKKLYITGVKDGGEGVYSLVADDGEFMASHFCSHAGYARWDLERGKPDRQKEWKARFGEYRVLMLGEDEITEEKLWELNKKWYEGNAKEVVL